MRLRMTRVMFPHVSIALSKFWRSCAKLISLGNGHFVFWTGRVCLCVTELGCDCEKAALEDRGLGPNDLPKAHSQLALSPPPCSWWQMLRDTSAWVIDLRAQEVIKMSRTCADSELGIDCTTVGCIVHSTPARRSENLHGLTSAEPATTRYWLTVWTCRVRKELKVFTVGLVQSGPPPNNMKHGLKFYSSDTSNCSCYHISMYMLPLPFSSVSVSLCLSLSTHTYPYSFDCSWVLIHLPSSTSLCLFFHHWQGHVLCTAKM